MRGMDLIEVARQCPDLTVSIRLGDLIEANQLVFIRLDCPGHKRSMDFLIHTSEALGKPKSMNKSVHAKRRHSLTYSVGLF